MVDRVPEWQAHWRLTAIGYLGTPAGDMFSYGINMTGEEAPGVWGEQSGRDAWNQRADIIKDFHGSSGAQISNTAVLTHVKVARISGGTGGPGGAGGKYIGEPEIFEYQQPGNITGASYVLPQSAFVVSMSTSLNTPRGRGRFYLPMPAIPVVAGDEFRIAIGNAGTLRDRCRDLLVALNDWTGIDPLNSPEVAVVSSYGVNRKVTGVTVGRVIDTMRSRRNRLAEQYLDVEPVS